MARPGTSSAIGNIAQSQTDATLTAEDTAAALAAPSTRQKIVVQAVAMVSGGTGTSVTFNSKGSGAGTAISALFANAANGGAVLPFNERGWFATKLGETLTVTTGAGSTTGIVVNYKVI